jgi:hypothetical protein
MDGFFTMEALLQLGFFFFFQLGGAGTGNSYHYHCICRYLYLQVPIATYLVPGQFIALLIANGDSTCGLYAVGTFVCIILDPMKQEPFFFFFSLIPHTHTHTHAAYTLL